MTQLAKDYYISLYLQKPVMKKKKKAILLPIEDSRLLPPNERP